VRIQNAKCTETRLSLNNAFSGDQVSNLSEFDSRSMGLGLGVYSLDRSRWWDRSLAGSWPVTSPCIRKKVAQVAIAKP